MNDFWSLSSLVTLFTLLCVGYFCDYLQLHDRSCAKVSTQDNTHANKTRNEHKNADTKRTHKGLAHTQRQRPAQMR